MGYFNPASFEGFTCETEAQRRSLNGLRRSYSPIPSNQVSPQHGPLFPHDQAIPGEWGEITQADDW